MIAMTAILLQVRSWVLARTSPRAWKRVVLGAALTNVLGLAAFAYFSSGYWLEPDDGLSLDYGNVILWGFTAVPVFLLSVGLDIFWLALIGILSRSFVRWRLLRLWLLVVGCWVVAWFAPDITRVFALATMP